ncbi:MAG: phosphatidate cytidylyltransferase [Bacteroidota bacterium]
MNETLKRALSGAVYIALLIFCIQYQYINPKGHSFFILFGIFLLIAVYEFCSLISINKILPIFFSGIVYFIYFKTNFKQDIPYLSKPAFELTLTALIITILVAIKGIFFLFEKENSPIDKLSKYIYLVGYVILPFVFITKIPFGIKGYNPKIIISIFILIWTNDTFAYIVGKSIGKHKLFERISPKKTIEGFIGGVVFAVIASYIISRYYIEVKESATYIWIVIAVIVGVFGTIGDLIESKFKRIAGIKDSGKIMPGHGGILDRLDSVIFVAPIVFLFYQILNLL